MKIFKFIASLFIGSLLASSCTKYKDIGSSDFYPDQNVYLPAAVDGVSSNGIYSISTVAVPGRTFRYIADVPNKKLVIPLSVYRSGLDNKGTVSANIVINTDTVAKFLTAGKFPVGTELLPADKYTVENSVTINDGSETANFSMSVDLNFLLANLTKKYAIGIAVTSNGKGAGPASTAVVLIDPAFLVPTANFSTTVSGKTVNFSNTSTNAVSYSWNYGDGSTPSTATAAPYTYAASGTYTVTLTATGALGASNPAVKTATVVIP